jgi:flagellar basal-body rod protein FlgB
MDLSRIPLFAALKTKMAWLNDRQSILAQNVANADTPHYAAKDLKPIDFKTMVAGARTGVRLETTDPGHIAAGAEGDAAAGFKSDSAKPFEVSPSGNGVSLEEQMMKVSETRASYEMALNLYQKQIGMLRTALGRGQG